MKTKKKEERIHERGDKDGGSEERICNTMRKEGIESSDLVKKMATKNPQNKCNKTKQQSEDILEQRRKNKNKNCYNKKEKYSS